MDFTIGSVVLAAGEGKRLKLNAPKPLAPCVGKKLVDFPITELKKFMKQNRADGIITAVIGHQKELVQTYIEKNYPEVTFAVQEEQRGTADALRSYFSFLNKNENLARTEYLIVICADTPVVSAYELNKMFQVLVSEKLDAVAATFIKKNPKGYGRIVRASKGFHVVEEKDGDLEILKITEVNSGLYIFKTNYVEKYLAEVNSNNKSGEFYLTDVFKDGLNVRALCFPEGEIFLGVNTLQQLEDAENAIRSRKKEELRSNGVRFIDSSHSYIDSDVEIGTGTIIYPNTFLKGKTVIGKNVEIEMGVQISDSIIEDEAKILSYSILEKARVQSRASIGPFARLRPGTDIGEEAKVGNFVEIKKSVLDKGVKVSHLSYVGDAFIGEETNIGCGFITCNYDGANKHITKIGKNCFIGSDSQTIAPVTIEDNCFVASSSTITKNMPEGSFAISRGHQSTKEGIAKKFIKIKKEVIKCVE